MFGDEPFWGYDRPPQSIYETIYRGWRLLLLLIGYVVTVLAIMFIVIALTQALP